MSNPRAFSTPVLTTLGIVVVLAGLVMTRRPPAPIAAPPARADSVIADTVAPSSPMLAAPPSSAPPVGQFVYLFDVSASTKTAKGPSPFEEGLALLQPAFAALRSMEEVSPQRHRVATIGAMSLGPAARCDIFVPTQTLFTSSDPQKVDGAVRACERDLRALPPEQYTDISGALVNAALSIQGARRSLRGIVLFTDLDEDSAPGTVAGRPDLRHVCVAVYTLVTPDAARDPALMNRRASEWREKLKGWGAKSVFTGSARGFDEADLRGFFRGCE